LREVNANNREECAPQIPRPEVKGSEKGSKRKKRHFSHVVVEIRVSILFSGGVFDKSPAGVHTQSCECNGTVGVDIPDPGQADGPSDDAQK
jgi:hypothetical protein